MIAGELLHVAVQLDVALLLGDPHVARDVPRDPVPGRSPREPPPVPGDVVEEIAHLADVDRLEREVVEVRVADIDEGHHVVVAADVEPDARLVEPVRDLHPEHLGVERDPVMDAAGEAVDVTELAWATELDRARGPRVLRPPVDLGRGFAIRQQLHRPAVGIVDEQRALGLAPRAAGRLEVSLRIGERAVGRQLEGEVIEARVLAGHELEAVRLVVAGEQHPARRARPLGQAELDRPAGGRLIEVGHPEADVVEPVESHSYPAT